MVVLHDINYSVILHLVPHRILIARAFLALLHGLLPLVRDSHNLVGVSAAIRSVDNLVGHKLDIIANVARILPNLVGLLQTAVLDNVLPLNDILPVNIPLHLVDGMVHHVRVAFFLCVKDAGRLVVPTILVILCSPSVFHSIATFVLFGSWKHLAPTAE